MGLHLRMKPKTLLVTVLLVLLWLSAAVVTAQRRVVDDSDAGEPVFHEIELTSEGVTAVDTAGNNWYYDFSVDSFKAGAERPSPRGTEGEGLSEGGFEPVETRCTELRTIKKLSDYVLIGYDEYVDGDVYAVGRVTVKGWVKGNVRSLSDKVLVTESGQVDGDIRAPEIEIRPGGQLLGQQVIVDKFLDFGADEVFSSATSVDGLIVVTGITAFFLLIAFLSHTLMPKHTERFSACMSQYRLRTWVIGLVTIFLLPLVIGILAITIVGIIVIPFVPFLVVLAIAWGTTTYGRHLWVRVSRLFIRDHPRPMVDALAGTVLVMLVWFFTALLLSLPGDVAHGFGIAALVFTILFSTIPLCRGVGAALLTRFGYREYAGSRRKGVPREAPAPAPPPIPSVPPMMAPVVPPRPDSEPSGPLSSDRPSA